MLAWIVRTIMIRDHDYGGGTMNVLIIGVILGLLIWGLVSQNGVIRIIARIITGSLTLLSFVFFFFLLVFFYF